MHDRLVSGPRLALLALVLSGAIGRSVAHAADALADHEVDAASEPVAPRSDAAPDDGVPGTWLSAEPADLELALGAPSADRIRRHLEAGDLERGLAEAERLAVARPPGRERDAARMVIGIVNRDRDRHNLASEAFAEVAASLGPLAPYAAYYRAEQDQLRERPSDAIGACEDYRRRWPAGPHVTDCLRIVALSYAALGNPDGARSSARAYDQAHPTAPISEQVELHLGLRLADTQPTLAAGVFAGLAVNHEAALTGRVAEEQLARLAAARVPGAALPQDVASLMGRAVSLRQAGRRDEAWKAFEQLRSMSESDAGLRAWVEMENERFGWRTRRWAFLADLYDAEFRRTGDPRWAWQRYKVLGRDGRHDEAGTLALEMQRVPGASRYWGRTEDDVGRTLLLAKRYAEARDQFDEAARRGGYSGRRAAFDAAFAALMAEEAEDAVARFTSVIADGRSSVVESRYWRASALRALEREGEAAADEAWILEYEPWSWYASLVRAARGEVPTAAPFARNGAWAGQPPEQAAGIAAAPIAAAPIAAAPIAAAPIAAVLPRAAPVPLGFAVDRRFADWRWGTAPVASVPARLEPSRIDPEVEPPRSYRASTLFDPDRGRTALAGFADQHVRHWPELQAISDLASVGLYDLSGPMFADWFEAWRIQVRKRDRTARKLVGTAPEAWRQVFLTTRDHHHTAKDLYDTWQAAPQAHAAEVSRLAFPLAHDRYVWTHARQHGLDPFLVLGLMRQESTYDTRALSRVGARGAMQIMPKTGHLLADLAHDIHYDAGDLEDPTVAVGYGIRYLGLLMERFDDVYPLAVASYNGGPFNVSTWLEAVGADTPMDVFVEHIPFRETRDYVKKVSEGYAAYVALYGHPGSGVAVPPQPRADRAEVVDF